MSNNEAIARINKLCSKFAKDVREQIDGLTEDIDNDLLHNLEVAEHKARYVTILIKEQS